MMLAVYLLYSETDERPEDSTICHDNESTVHDYIVFGDILAVRFSSYICWRHINGRKIS
jgi:hypothetical protein